MVTVDQACDAGHGAGGQLTVAARAGDQRDAQDGPVDSLARVHEHPASPAPGAGTILDALWPVRMQVHAAADR
ncbi:hypothetical protein [Streptomyces sp. NPDC088760]|uniref:hypothetical protein n=1 Tax=Streptomyces sp. NPDC088760 TaxID=3365890 RepID=UPI00381F2AD2